MVHPDTIISDRKTVLARAFVPDPIHIPDDFAGFSRCLLDAFDGVFGEFTEELQIIAVHTKPVEHETGVRYFEGERARGANCHSRSSSVEGRGATFRLGGVNPKQTT